MIALDQDAAIEVLPWFVCNLDAGPEERAAEMERWRDQCLLQFNPGWAALTREIIQRYRDQAIDAMKARIQEVERALAGTISGLWSEAIGPLPPLIVPPIWQGFGS